MPTILYTTIAVDTLTSAGVSVVGHAFVGAGHSNRLALLLDTPAGQVRLTDTDTGALSVTLNGDPSDPDGLADALSVDNTVGFASALDELLTASITAFSTMLAGHREAVADELVADLVVDLSSAVDPT